MNGFVRLLAVVAGAVTLGLGATAGATLSSQRNFQSVMVVPSGRTLARWAAQSLVWRRIGQIRVAGPATGSASGPPIR